MNTIREANKSDQSKHEEISKLNLRLKVKHTYRSVYISCNIQNEGAGKKLKGGNRKGKKFHKRRGKKLQKNSLENCDGSMDAFGLGNNIPFTTLPSVWTFPARRIYVRLGG